MLRGLRGPRHLRLGEDEVVEGIAAGNGYTAGSLDVPAEEGSDGGGSSLADRLGGVDPAIEGVENLEALKPLVEKLGERDRRILSMRFVSEMTQAEIGAELGISQMHVSRLLSRILGRLRNGLLAQE